MQLERWPDHDLHRPMFQIAVPCENQLHLLQYRLENKTPHTMQSEISNTCSTTDLKTRTHSKFNSFDQSHQKTLRAFGRHKIQVTLVSALAHDRSNVFQMGTTCDDM